MSATTSLIRQWWYLYAEVLRRGTLDHGSELGREFLAQDDAVAAAGITKPGCPMPRTGAKDLASECDRLRKFR